MEAARLECEVLYICNNTIRINFTFLNVLVESFNMTVARIPSVYVYGVMHSIKHAILNKLRLVQHF